MESQENRNYLENEKESVIREYKDVSSKFTSFINNFEGKNSTFYLENRNQELSFFDHQNILALQVFSQISGNITTFLVESENNFFEIYITRLLENETFIYFSINERGKLEMVIESPKVKVTRSTLKKTDINLIRSALGFFLEIKRSIEK